MKVKIFPGYNDSEDLERDINIFLETVAEVKSLQYESDSHFRAVLLYEPRAGTEGKEYSDASLSGDRF